MSDIFDAFESTPSNNFFDSGADPAADFLAKEEAELAKIENHQYMSSNQADPFQEFGKS